jgi:chromosome segregation ATPase
MAAAASGLDQAALDAVSRIVSEAIAPLRLDINTIKDDIVTIKNDITGVRARLDNVDGRLDNIDGRLGGMDNRLNVIDASLVQVRENGEALRHIVLDQGNRLVPFQNAIQNAVNRVNAVEVARGVYETQLSGRVENLRQEADANSIRSTVS